VADGLILEFSEGGEAEYRAVSAHLGVDVETGIGDWPEGLLSHAAGTSSNGTWVVMEVWSSREVQAAFMESRLGAALAAGGATAVPTVTWVELAGFHQPGGRG
jgi:hypothetical protein